MPEKAVKRGVVLGRSLFFVRYFLQFDFAGFNKLFLPK